jgi:SAM-dependent methyltransferase
VAYALGSFTQNGCTEMSLGRTVIESPLTLCCPACTAPIPLSWQSETNALHCAQCKRSYYHEDGILVLGENANHQDQPDDVYPALAAAEPRHFWFRARNRIIESALRETMGPLRGRSVLDVGCGTGFVLSSLEQAGMRTCGLDMYTAALRFARGRTCGPLLQSMAESVPFERQFDVVLLCDVIEHTVDDSDVLRRASGALKEDGLLLVTVPAHQWLWTSLDDISGHKRRYTRATLIRAMKRADLSVRLARYFNIVLLPLQALQRLPFKNRRSGAPGQRVLMVQEALRPPPKLVNSLLAEALRLDVPLGRVPFLAGSSLVAVGRRSQSTGAG